MDELYYERLASKAQDYDMKNLGPSDIGKMSAKVNENASKREQCEQKSKQIIEYLIYRTLDPATFIRCLRHITQDNFQDILEERAISKMCGYPICAKALPNMPAKKYHISTKQNKVFDITERKNFCSNFCYTASLHIKNQIETSPLWLRNYYSTPEYALLENTVKVIPGVEIGENEESQPLEEEIKTVESFAAESIDIFKPGDTETPDDKQKTSDEKKTSFSEKKVKPGDNETPDDKQKTSDEKKTSFSEREVKLEKKAEKKSEEKSMKKVQFCEEDNLEIYDEEIQISTANRSVETEQRSILKKTETVQVESNELEPEKTSVHTSVKLTAIKETVFAREQPSRAEKNYQFAPKKQIKTIKNQSTNENELVEHIQKCMNEWFTLETFLFLYGEEKLKQVFQEHKLQDDILKSLKENANSYMQRQKYQDICKRLNLMALADKNFDISVLGNSKKPLPSYKRLKQESNVMDIQVKSFLQGKEVEIEEEDSDDDVSDENAEMEHKVPAVLPMTDANSQNALRRKVFLTSINRVIHKMNQTLGLSCQSIISDVNLLVNTFRLQAHNIVFKPKQWNLVGLILINVLSIRDIKLKENLETNECREYAADILNSLKQSNNSLEPMLADTLNINKYIVNVYLK